MTIEEKYIELLNTSSDVNENFPLIRKSVEKGDAVIELGVRDCVSTWALLANKPKVLISVDINYPSKANLEEVEKAAKEAGVNFKFIQHSSLNIKFSAMDVLFVDTLHLYSHLVKELWRHAEQVQKRIIFHDIKIPEVYACIQDFLYNDNWEIEEVSSKCNGLLVAKRVKRII